MQKSDINTPLQVSENMVNKLSRQSVQNMTKYSVYLYKNGHPQLLLAVHLDQGHLE